MKIWGKLIFGIVRKTKYGKNGIWKKWNFVKKNGISEKIEFWKKWNFGKKWNLGKKIEFWKKWNLEKMEFGKKMILEKFNLEKNVTPFIKI